MTQSFRRSLKRLAGQYARAALGMALILYATIRAIMAAGSNIDPSVLGWDYFTFVVLFFGGLVFLICMVPGWIALKAQDRLVQQFRVCGPSDREHAFYRQVKPQVPWPAFLLALRRIFSATSMENHIENTDLDSAFDCRIHLADHHNYKLHVARDGEANTATIRVWRVQRWLTGAELEVVQLVAGLVRRTADDGLIERDFFEPCDPARLEKDLGGWIPRTNAGRAQ